MTSDPESFQLGITFPLATITEPLYVTAGPDDRSGDLARIAMAGFQMAGLELPLEGQDERWRGMRSEGSWTLRENRDMEEGRWWTEAEVESYQDREALPYGVR